MFPVIVERFNYLATLLPVRIARLFRPYRGRLALIALAILVTSALGVITPLTVLPTVTGQTSFNSLLQTGVVIDGAGGAFDGLTLGVGSGGSTIQGLTIQHFATSIIHVQSNDNTIAGNVIGASGGGNSVGVLIDGGSTNMIGGTTAAAANTIGFNTTADVQILGAAATGNSRGYGAR